MIDKLVWPIIEIINTFLETLITYWFFKGFLGINPLRKKYIDVIGFLTLFTTASILYAIDPNPVLTIIFTVVSMFLYSLLFEGNIKAKSFISILLSTIGILSEFMALYTIMLLAKVTEQTTVEDGPYRLMGIVISGILYLVITRLLCLAKNRKMNLMVPTRYWLMLLIVPILSILATYTVFLFNSFVKVEEMSLLAYITQISLLFINYIAFYLFIKLVEDFNIKTEYKLLKQQVDFQKNHYDDLEISSNEMRSFRHDIKNHLQNLDELIIANKNDEADKYIKSFSDIINISNRVIDTGNSVLDAILNAKLMVIKEKNIPFDYKIEIPNQIKIEPADICVLLGNSLDNAIEACDRIDSNDKKISMILAYGSEGLIYSLSNTTDGNLVANGESFLSSKNNYSEHGLGLLNIEKTTEKYKGIFLTEHKNNNFKLVASLYGA